MTAFADTGGSGNVDGSYAVFTTLMDCWTPEGMLSQNESKALTVRGDLWQDWHAGPLKPK